MQSTNFIAGYTQNIFCICHIHNYTRIFWIETWRLLTGPVCIQKVFSSLHNSQIEPLMTILGLFWWCLSYFSGPWQCYLLGSQWDSHKPGFHPKYLKLCPEDELGLYGLERHGVSQGGLKDWCPAEFSFNLPQHTCREVASIPSKSLISCFRCKWFNDHFHFGVELPFDLKLKRMKLCCSASN